MTWTPGTVHLILPLMSKRIAQTAMAFWAELIDERLQRLSNLFGSTLTIVLSP